MINQLEIDMQKRIEALKVELSKLRTGRAHPGLIEHVKVDYYGSEMPLNQVAGVTVSDPRTLTITPWEKPLLKVIEKAIMNAGLGLNPMNDGNVIRIPMPLLNEERRRDLVKIVKSEGEQGRVSLRNLRRDANNTLKDMLKKKEISEDDDRRAEEQVQKITDKFIAEADKILVGKEAELMAV
ncbi:MAG: ribosome recycling factor [Gammaproteobacteria bacterium GWE2_37_16]|nr:MAG: ribosome recycling factor [Gammaproteobacteria bacterium GWE2_37_16]